MKKIIPIIDLSVKLASIKRTVGYTKEHSENDAEHSYQLALVCWMANQQYNLGLKDELILKFALIHDLVEVYAGDTDAHDTEEMVFVLKKEKEEEAFEILKKEYAEYDEMLDLIKEYEKKDKVEAQLVHMLDKFIPDANIHNCDGDYYKTRKITMNDWREWLLKKIDYNFLDSRLKPLFDESVKEVKSKFKDIFYQK